MGFSKSQETVSLATSNLIIKTVTLSSFCFTSAKRRAKSTAGGTKGENVHPTSHAARETPIIYIQQKTLLETFEPPKFKRFALLKHILSLLVKTKAKESVRVLS